MKFKKIILIIIIAIIGYFTYDLSKKLPIVTSYVAKDVCSSLFIGGRNIDSILNNDVNYNFMKYSSIDVDKNDKSITSRIFGLFPRKAIFRGKLGCCITHNYNENKLKAIKITPTPDLINIPVNEETDSIINEIDTNKLTSAINNVFSEQERTRAVVIIYKNRLVAEKYADGIQKNTPLLGWSMDKSIINALTGVMVKKGAISTDDNSLFNIWSNDDRSKITLNNLLQMSSGLEWDEGYGGVSDVTNMLYKNGDMSAYAINKPIDCKPDKKFNYSSGTTNIISKYLRNKSGNDNNYYKLAYNFFNKLGMQSMTFETDASGTFVGSSYGYATARDWAKFGMLYYNNGKVKNEQILPEGWVKYTSTPANTTMIYGAQFWLNRGKTLPDVPEDEYRCQGHHGQIVSIIPSKHLVVVRLGLSINKKFDKNKFISEVVDAIR